MRFAAGISFIIALVIFLKNPRLSLWLWKEQKYLKHLLIGICLLNLGLVLGWGVNFPYGDTFDEIKLYEADFEWSVLANPTGGHLGVFARVVYWIIAQTTYWNFNILFLIHWIALCLYSLMICFFVKKESRPDSLDHTHWLMALLAISTVNATYLYDSRLLMHLLAMPITLGCILCAHSPRRFLKWGVGPVLVVLGVFNSAWGVVAPAVILPWIILNSKKDIARTLLWSSASGFAFWILLGNFKSGYSGESSFDIGSLLAGLADGLILLGMPIYPADMAQPFGLVALGGVLYLGILALVLVQGSKERGILNQIFSPAGMAIACAILCGLLATVARAKFYPYASLSMRYHATAILAWAGLMVLINQSSVRVHPWALKWKNFLKLALIPILIWGTVFGIRKNWGHHIKMARAAECLKSPNPYSDFRCYHGVIWDIENPAVQDRFKKTIEFMKKNRLALF